MHANTCRTSAILGRDRYPDPFTQLSYDSDADSICQGSYCWASRCTTSRKRRKICPEFLVCTRIRSSLSWLMEWGYSSHRKLVRSIQEQAGCGLWMAGRRDRRGRDGPISPIGHRNAPLWEPEVGMRAVRRSDSRRSVEAFLIYTV